MPEEHLTPDEKQALDAEITREQRRTWRWDLIGCFVLLVVAIIVGGVLYARDGARLHPIDPRTEAQPDLTPRR